MRFFFIIIYLTLIVFSSSRANEIKIVYIDTIKILNESTAAKDIKKQLEVLNKQIFSDFKKNEKKIFEEEKKISKQKNILSKEELEKQINAFQKKVIKFKNDVKNDKNNLIIKKDNATKKILNVLNPILADYATKNSISIILQKNLIVIGKEDLDITKEILEIINKKIKKVKLN